MTFEQISRMNDDWITPAVAASAMRMDPGRLIEYARSGQLPFAVQISGNRVKIARESFLDAYGYGSRLSMNGQTAEVPEISAAANQAIVIQLLREIRELTAMMQKTLEGGRRHDDG